VSFYHQNTKLGTRSVAAGTTFDVVWKDPTGCSNGYVSPPVALTWTSAKTGATGAPVLAPCNPANKFTWPDDWECVLTINTSTGQWTFECHWTYKGRATTSALKVPSSSGPGVASLYLYKRTALYANVSTPGQPTKKVSVPAGADTIKFAVAG
jgi:hypothetical protein